MKYKGEAYIHIQNVIVQVATKTFRNQCQVATTLSSCLKASIAIMRPNKSPNIAIPEIKRITVASTLPGPLRIAFSAPPKNQAMIIATVQAGEP